MPGQWGTKVRGYEIGGLVARVSPARMTLTLCYALGSFGGSLSGVGEDGRKRGEGGLFDTLAISANSWLSHIFSYP